MSQQAGPAHIARGPRCEGRSLNKLLETVDELKASEINLISLEKRIDTTCAAGERVVHVFGSIAQFERRRISKRN